MVVVRLQSRRVNAWRSRAARSCRLRIAPKERSLLTSRPRGCVACPDELGLIGGSRLDIVWTGPERGTWNGASLPRLTLDLQPRQPVEPARQVPVPVAGEFHRAGEGDGGDERGVDEERGGDPEAHLLEHDQLAAREAGEDGDDDQGGARDDAGGRGDAEAGAIRRVAGFVVGVPGP